jgi:hypothetical protein
MTQKEKLAVSSKALYSNSPQRTEENPQNAKDTLYPGRFQLAPA